MLTGLSIASTTEPFSRKLGFLISFPLQKNGHLVLLLFSVLFSFLSNNLMSYFFFLLLTFPLSQYLFELMERLANGKSSAPKLSKIFKFAKMDLFIKLILGLGFSFIFVSKIDTIIGAVLSNILVALIIVAFPASIIIVMMEKRWFSMLNPVKIFHLIKLLRLSYVVLLMVAAGAFTLLSQSSVFDEQGSHNYVVIFSFNLISIYLFMLLFSMLGYLVFSYHVELNYNVSSSHLESLRTINKNSKINRREKANHIRSVSLTEIEIFIQEGRFEDAQKSLLENINSNESDFQSFEKLILLYSFQENAHHLKLIADRYFESLLNNHKDQKAADFYCKLVERSDYSLDDVEMAFKLVEKMSSVKQFVFAIELLNQFDCTPTGGDFWDRMALQKASLLTAFSKDTLSAKKIITLVLKRSMNQDVLERAQKLERILLKSS
jgi:hypothetical protein